MTIAEIAEEYRRTARRIKARIKELQAKSDDGYMIQGRIRLLSSMVRDLTDTALYLERRYCGRRR